MGLVKTRGLAAMHKQQCAKAGLKSRQLKVPPPTPSRHPLPPHFAKFGGNSGGGLSVV